MENELFQSIGRLYVEALRLQNMIQQLQEQTRQLQEQITAKDVTISQLQSVPKPTVTAERLPPELVTNIADGS